MLGTPRLLLRDFEVADVDPLYEIQGDQNVMRYTFWAESREQCAAHLQAYADSRKNHGFAPWTVVLKAENRVIGWGGLGIDPHAPNWGPEVVYFLHPDYWGQGFASEVVAVSLEHGFGSLGLERIGAFARPENEASIRVLKKAGFLFRRYEPALGRNHYEISTSV